MKPTESRTAGPKVEDKTAAKEVPDISQPTESRTADPHINENEVEKAVGVRHAEAAEQRCTAGGTVAWAAD